MLVLFLIALVLFVIYLVNQIRKPFNYPPGPSWLPFVGNLPELKSLSRKLGGQHLALLELSKLYKTDVLGLKLGNNYVVTVCGYHAVKSVLTGDEFDGRPDNFFMRLRTMGTRKGVTCTDGEYWKIQRNFLTTHLRNLGFGKKPMELMIKEEVTDVLNIIERNGIEIKIGEILAPSVINILWALTSGSRISRTDKRIPKLLALLNIRSKAFDMSGGTLSQHPWLRFIAPEKTGYNLIKRLNEELKAFFMDTINEHYKNWTEDRNDDVIFAFISEMKKSNNKNSTFTEDQLVMLCLDIFIAGAQTTSNTLDFAFLMMILYPDVQEKVHAYLDDVFDKDQSLDYSDRLKIPYVEAVLFEVERFCHVVPITGPRRVLRDTQLNGYSIPKDTTILIHSYSVHHDKSYWKDPEIFRPERFLDEKGKLLTHDRFIPFGLGRRRCLGEILARNCIFMFFTEIMRKYKIIKMPGSKDPKGIPIPGITLTPEIYRAKFIRKI